MEMNLPPELAVLPHAPLTVQHHDAVEMFFSDQLEVRYEVSQCAAWAWMCGRPRPCFNAGLLESLTSMADLFERRGGTIDHLGESKRIDYLVFASSISGVFNLGGDLAYFKSMIEARDLEAMRRYGYACIRPLYRSYAGFDTGITTVSLVQGQCLGGGFEMALSCDLIVAEKSATFGFPEILFGLFPGMGATSFLSRKVGERIMDRLLGSGEVIGAEEALRMGIIDQVCEDGEGPAAIEALIRRRRNQVRGYSALAMAKRRARNCPFDELAEIVELWARTAMHLSPFNLKLMGRLVKAQDGMAARAHGQTEPCAA